MMSERATAKVDVERATVEHMDDVLVLLKEYYAEVPVVDQDSSDALREYFERPDSGVWIAYADGVPAGCVMLRPLAGRVQAGECKRLYVQPRFRRRGIAACLLEALEAHASAASLEWIYLDSQDRLEAAIALYSQRGYIRCERYNDNTDATLFMRKSLRLDDDTVGRICMAYRAAVWSKDLEGFLGLYHPTARIFDLWNAWSYDGREAWRSMVVNWFAGLGTRRVVVDFDDVRTQASPQLIVAHAFVTYASLTADGAREQAMQNRLTWVLEPSPGGEWKIVHEHTSAPADEKTAKVMLSRA
jgi:uncharacterized protein (TIGR02246 family)